MITSKDIEELRKIRWFRIASRGKNHAVLWMDSAVWLANKNKYAKIILKFPYSCKYLKQSEGGRSMGQEDYENFIRISDEVVKKNPNFIRDASQKMIDAAKEVRTLTDGLKNKDWKEAGNEELIDYITKFCDLHARLWCVPFGWFYYLYLNDILAEKLVSGLAKKFDNKVESILPNLLAPERLSEISEEKKELIEIALKSIEKGKIDEKVIESHWKKYAYLNNYYFWGKGYSLDEMKKRLKEEIAKGKINMKKEYDELEVHELKYEVFNDNEKNLIKSMKKMAYAMQFIDESFIYGVHNARELYTESARRLGLNYNQLVSMRLTEIEESLNNKKRVVDKKILDERFEDHAFIVVNDEVYLLSGKELRKYLREDKKSQNVDEFKGNVGFKGGKIRGRVRILTYAEQISSFKEGEILVTPMTNPSYVPAMRKAAAIVTDDGGLLCHAAIISREMKIPCVIGTKIATQVLKDGDLIEVDADKGIVRIIERAK